MKQNNKLKIAITGGIGSGKSTVANIIAQNGFPVYSCDKVYADLLNSGYFDNIFKKEFGEEIFVNDKLSKDLLIKKLKKENSFNKLNKITHPIIMQKIFEISKGDDVAFFEVPLLFESKLESEFDQIIVVLRDFEERIKSVINRDKKDKNSIELLAKRQIDYNNIDFAKYYVIHNNGNFDDLSAKTNELLAKLFAK